MFFTDAARRSSPTLATAAAQQIVGREKPASSPHQDRSPPTQRAQTSSRPPVPRPRYLMHMPQVLLALNCRSLMATVFWLPCVQVRLRLLAPLLPYEQAPWASWPTPAGRQGPPMLVWRHCNGCQSNGKHAALPTKQQEPLQQRTAAGAHQWADWSDLSLTIECALQVREHTISKPVLQFL